MHPLNILQLHTRERQQAVVHPQVVLAHNMQIMSQHQVIIAVDAACQRVLDWDHTVGVFAAGCVPHRVEDRIEGLTRDRSYLGAEILDDGQLAISSRLTLKSAAQLRHSL